MRWLLSALSGELLKVSCLSLLRFFCCYSASPSSSSPFVDAISP